MTYLDSLALSKCATPPCKPYLFSCFILGLKSGIKQEKKKARRYAIFTKDTKVAMDVEDEGDGLDEAKIFEHVSLTKSPMHVRVEDRTGPMEGQEVIHVAIMATHNA